MSDIASGRVIYLQEKIKKYEKLIELYDEYVEASRKGNPEIHHLEDGRLYTPGPRQPHWNRAYELSQQIKQLKKELE